MTLIIARTSRGRLVPSGTQIIAQVADFRHAPQSVDLPPPILDGTGAPEATLSMFPASNSRVTFQSALYLMPQLKHLVEGDTNAAPATDARVRAGAMEADIEMREPTTHVLRGIHPVKGNVPVVAPQPPTKFDWSASTTVDASASIGEATDAKTTMTPAVSAKVELRKKDV